MPVVVLAGFAASAFLEWVLLSILQFRSGLPVVLIAAIHMALVLIANTAGIHVAASVLGRDCDGIAERSRTTAAWIAPLIVYFGANSIWAVPFAAFVAFTIVILIRSLPDDSKGSRVASSRVTSSGTFHLLAPRDLSTPLSFYCCGFCLEAAAVMVAAHAVPAAVALAAISAAITAGHIDAAHRANLKKSHFRQSASPLLTLVLAFVLTAGAIRGAAGKDNDAPIGDGRRDAFRGVYLWPDDESKAIQLVAPPRLLSSAAHDGRRVPVRIAFNGVYWLFRYPDDHPPEDSVTAHGSPERLRFRSTDKIPLIMEAHQHLDSPVDLSSWGKVEIEIGTADIALEPVLLEVILTDSSQAVVTGLSLGEVPVRPHLREQTIAFTVPQSPSVSNFDEITIRYHPKSQRDTESTQIGIRYLVLMPR